MITITNKRIGDLHLQGKRIAKAYTEGKLVYTRKQAQPDLGELVLVCDIPSENFKLDLSLVLSAVTGESFTVIDIDWGDTPQAEPQAITSFARSTAQTTRERYIVPFRENPPIPTISRLASYPVTESTSPETITHTYQLPGTYRINLRGSFKWIGGVSTNLKETLIEIELPSQNSPIKEISTAAFRDYTKLQDVHEKLFHNLAETQWCFALFYNNISLRRLREGLLDPFINCFDFSYAFANNTALLYVPENLFLKAVKCRNFISTFNNVSSLQSKIPPLWQTHPEAVHNNCFTGCTKAPNYAEAQAAGWA